MNQQTKPILLMLLAFIVMRALLNHPTPTPGPTPTPAGDAALAESSGRQYLSSLADTYEWAATEIDKDPEVVSTIGEKIKERTTAAREQAAKPLNDRMQQLIKDAGGSEAALREFAKGMRKAAE